MTAMSETESLRSQLAAAKQRLAQLEQRLAQAETALAETKEMFLAIHAGDVDALVIPGPDGDRVFTLSDAEYAYRALVEAMNEGAAMLGPDGCVLYCNERFAMLFNTALHQIIGKWVADLLTQEGALKLQQFLAESKTGDITQTRFDCAAAGATRTPLCISLRTMSHFSPGALCMVVTDISSRKQQEMKLQVLLKEVHHRVKNNLQVVSSLLEMQAGAIDDPLVAVALHNSEHRVQSMALIHELLYGSDSLEDVDFSLYVERLMQELLVTYPLDTSNIQLRLEVDAMRLDIDTAVPCGLILNELISNSLKYAFTRGVGGQLCVTLACCSDNQIRLAVEDNGIGLAKDFSMAQSRSLGLRIVQILTKQLGGSLHVKGNPAGRGTCFEVIFPLVKA